MPTAGWRQPRDQTAAASQQQASHMHHLNCWAPVKDPHSTVHPGVLAGCCSVSTRPGCSSQPATLVQGEAVSPQLQSLPEPPFVARHANASIMLMGFLTEKRTQDYVLVIEDGCRWPAGQEAPPSLLPRCSSAWLRSTLKHSWALCSINSCSDQAVLQVCVPASAPAAPALEAALTTGCCCRPAACCSAVCAAVQRQRCCAAPAQHART